MPCGLAPKSPSMPGARRNSPGRTQEEVDAAAAVTSSASLSLQWTLGNAATVLCDSAISTTRRFCSLPGHPQRADADARANMLLPDDESVDRQERQVLQTRRPMRLDPVHRDDDRLRVSRQGASVGKRRCLPGACLSRRVVEIRSVTDGARLLPRFEGPCRHSSGGARALV
jgi:hypothetical protein